MRNADSTQHAVLPKKNKNIKDKLLALISHEIRTPLHAILGYTEILLDETFGNINPKQYKYLNGIHNNGQRLLDLVTNILDYSILSNDKATLELSEINTSTIVKSLKETFIPIAQSKNIHFTVYTSKAPYGFVADKKKITQAISNLISNSIKFTPTRGKVWLKIKDDTNNKKMIFEVGDTGMGISRSDIKYIFDPFFQVDPSTSRKESGAGIGLSIVNNIAQLHDGKIEVSSEVDNGTVFRINIPKIVSSTSIRTSSSLKLLRSYDINEPSIAIIGCSNSAYLIKGIIAGHGYYSDVIQNRSNIMERLEKNSPVAIIFDISTYSTNTAKKITTIFSNIKAIRENSRFNATPILLTNSAVDDLPTFDITIVDKTILNKFINNPADKSFEMLISKLHKLEVYDESKIIDGFLSYPAFRRQLSREISRANRNDENIAVAMMVIDRYNKTKLDIEEINHVVKIGELIKSNIRIYDYISKHDVSGYSILLPAIKEGSENVIFNKIKNIVDTYLEQNDIDCKASIGFCTFPRGGKTVGGLIQKTIDNLVKSLNIGGNEIVGY